VLDIGDIKQMGVEVEVEAITLVCGLENWENWCPPARHFYTGPGGGHTHAHTGDGELFDRKRGNSDR
jgi:hypothetical protein